MVDGLADSGEEAPVRLCCFERHFGALCPDGQFMCELCFERCTIEEASIDGAGDRVNVCWPCAWLDGPQLACVVMAPWLRRGYIGGSEAAV